jgi:YD repeat-containing protein
VPVTAAGGLVTSVTDPMGRKWTYAYNGAGDLISATTRLASNPTRPQRTRVRTPTALDPPATPLQANDLLTIASPNAQPNGPDAGDDTVDVYNGAGRLTAQTDPWATRPPSPTAPAQRPATRIDSATGNGVVTVTDPDGNKKVYTYDQGTLASEATASTKTGIPLRPPLRTAPVHKPQQPPPLSAPGWAMKAAAGMLRPSPPARRAKPGRRQ